MKKSSIFYFAAAALPVFILAPGKASKQQKADFVGVNFAHRGLHCRDRSVPENSVEGFRLAAERGYGIELDVRLSKDGQVVVFHDDSLKRVCGIEKRVDELTYVQLQEFNLYQTEYHIPLFTDALKKINGRVPLIVEIKSGKRNFELCRKTYNIIAAYDGPVCIESFDPLIVMWFRIFGRELLRGQLAMQYRFRNEYPGLTGPLRANLFYNFLARPHFIAYRIGGRSPAVRFAEALGALKFCWTSREVGNEAGMDGVIFEFYKPDIRFK